MIDPISKEITELARVSAVQKRTATEWILFMAAVGMIFGWFIFVIYIINVVEQKKGELTNVTYTAYL